jgi:hypothetical protein
VEKKWMQKFKILAAGLFIVLFSIPVIAQDSPTILTVYGNIVHSNRSASDPFFDSFLSHHDRTFEKAYEFNLNALAALNQKEVIARADGWANAVTLKGPSLKDVLEKTGAVSKNITVTALDGYSVEFTSEELQKNNWILALYANGKPLSIGGRGPLWLTYDTSIGIANSDEEAKWVWSVFVIEVRD